MQMRRVALIWLLLMGWVLPVLGQEEPPPSPTPVSDGSPAPMHTPFPLDEIATQLESTEVALQEIRLRIEKTGVVQKVEQELLDFSQKLDVRVPEVVLKLAQGPSLNELRDLDAEWSDLSKAVAGWKLSLATRGTEVGVDRLTQLRDSWLATSNVPGSAELPIELRDKIQSTIEELEKNRAQAASIRDGIQVLLTRINQIEGRVDNVKVALTQSRESRVQQLLLHDSAPLWKLDFGQLALRSLPYDTLLSLRNQLQEVATYFGKFGERILLHAMTFALLVLGLRGTRQRVKPWTEKEPILRRPFEVFATPVATGLLLSMFFTPWFYPQPPAMLTALLGTTALVPACIVLRRLLERKYHLVLYGLVFLFLVDQLRALTAPQILLTRLIFTVEIGLSFLYLLWQVRFAPVPEVWHQRLRVVAVGFFGFSFGVVNLGFVSLGYLVGDAALHSAYLAMLLFCLVRILDGLVIVTLRSRPFSLLASVRNYRPRYRKYITRAVRVLAVFLWFWNTLEFLAIRTAVLQGFQKLTTSGVHIGAVSITLGGIVGLFLALWLPYQLSRFVRFALEEDVYTRLSLTRGATYTLSTMIHYVLLVAGALFGLAAVGIDMTRFTIVAGALSVGIGFGLQNIVNNFVSGLILLFERPVEVGHVVEVSGQVGTLQRIGLRASVLRTADGSEVIVPNGELLSTKVTNWTLSDQRRLLRIPVGVAYGTPPQKVSELLLGIAQSHPKILADPEPSVLFQNLGESSLDFEVRAWTEDFDRWVIIRSELVTSIYQALEEAKISIPFPHRTLQIENWPVPGPSESQE